MTFNLRSEQRTIDQYIDIDIPATRIRRMLRLVHVAAGYAFNKQYKETSGFDFKLEGGSKDIDEDKTLMEIESIIKNKNSITYNYKMTCDNGDEKYSAMNYRSPRAAFIEDMIEFINSRSLKSKLNVTEIKLHTLAGGKNPTLVIKSFYSYKQVDRKSGKVVSKKTSINYNLSLKYAGTSTTAGKLSSLKPNDVVPAITDAWLSPQEFYNNVTRYINSNSFPSASTVMKENYLEAVSNSWNNNSTSDKLGIAADMSSEFFEILSVLKLSKMLLNNDKNIKRVVGRPDDERISKVEIYLPAAANEALIDYKIAVNGNQDTPIKISVKSQVRGGTTATVKFTTAFANEAEVHKWYKNIINSSRTNQIGQRTIASSAMEYNKYTGKGTLYPIRALRKLFYGSKKSQVKRDFQSVLDTSSMTVDEWMKILTTIDKKISSISLNYTPLDEIILDSTLLKKAKYFIADNLFKEPSKTQRVKECISLSIDEAEKRSPNNKYPFALNNVALLCERALVKTSYKEGASQFNFYKLFYEQVLLKRTVVYSITKQEDISGQLMLKYNFVSAVNFEQYKQWIGLRTKNYANNMQDALGMGV
jgi:hypothetical protein